MMDLLAMAVFLASYLLLQLVVLPRLGIRT